MKHIVRVKTYCPGFRCIFKFFANFGRNSSIIDEETSGQFKKFVKETISLKEARPCPRLLSSIKLFNARF